MTMQELGALAAKDGQESQAFDGCDPDEAVSLAWTWANMQAEEEALPEDLAAEVLAAGEAPAEFRRGFLGEHEEDDAESV